MFDGGEVRKAYRDHLLKPVVFPEEIVSGEGVHLIGEDGKRYLDLTSGYGVSVLGYRNEFTEKVTEGIKKQVDLLVHNPHYLSYSSPAAELAEKLVEFTPPGLDRLFFTNSASEAVEGAIKVLRKASRGYELFALHGGFHGRTMGAVSLTGITADRYGSGPPLPGVHYLPSPFCERCSLNQTFPACDLACADYLQAVLKNETSGRPAAFFVEPILGDAGVIVPPPGYFERLAEHLGENHIRLAVDETLTGFGRTGSFFACEDSGPRPDCIILGKPLGGGLPLGGFVVSEEIGNQFDNRDFSSTMGGNPVACRAGLETLKVIEKEGLLDRAGETGGFLMDRLKELDDKRIGEVRGRGLLIGVEIVDRQEGAPDDAAAYRLKDELMKRGFLVTIYGASTIRLTPPLILQKDHAEEFVRGLRKSIEMI
ncbi:aspartate aminotransferase family protein [Candidatus Bipolaricaulota bacterium]|nr:aspartate aminotransferase family protein [Candidatus Bipolaricaulota bacterium]